MRRMRNGLVPFSVLALLLTACGDGGGYVNDSDAGSKGDSAVTADGGGTDSGGTDGAPQQEAGADASPGDKLQTVFIILLENHSWSTISKSKSAGYIDGTLVPMGGHAESYFTPAGNHPSEPNYIWLEAGDNLGITTDDDPAKNHQSTTDHLVTQLTTAGISWKAYAEDISGTDCPITSSGTYAAKHTPQLFFDDVTGTNDPKSADCIAHVVPYTKLATDLANHTVARYNFISPNLCDDMHGLNLSCGTQNFDEIGAGDAWLKAEVPKILASDAYKNNGVLFILWDEGDEPLVGNASDGPIPLVVLSPKAKANYKSSTKFTHSSMLRTVEEIFGVPLLRDAKNATDLSEFFTSFP